MVRIQLVHRRRFVVKTLSITNELSGRLSMGCDLLLSLSHLATPQLIRDRCQLNHLTSSVGGNCTVSRRTSRDSAISSSTLGRRDLFLSEPQCTRNWTSNLHVHETGLRTFCKTLTKAQKGQIKIFPREWGPHTCPGVIRTYPVQSNR